MKGKKLKIIKDCFGFIVLGLTQEDKDCVRNYAEQLQDLILAFLEE